MTFDVPTLANAAMRTLLLTNPVRTTFGILFGVVADGAVAYANASPLRTNEWIAAASAVTIFQWVPLFVVVVYLATWPFVWLDEHYGSRRLPPDYIMALKELQRRKRAKDIPSATYTANMMELQGKLVRSLDFARKTPSLDPSQPA